MSSPAFDIKTRLSDLVETTLKEGPQVVSKNGIETAVLVSIEDWNYIKAGQSWKLPNSGSGRSIKEILLDPDGPHDIYIPSRGRHRRRTPIELE